MKMAYIQWLGKELQRSDPEGSQLVVKEEHEKLPTIIHWCEDIGTPKVNEKMCTDPQCQRCLSGQGGYQFRWYSALWYEDYLRGSRPNCWKVGDTEDG